MRPNELVPPPGLPWERLWPDGETGPFRVRLWLDDVNGTQSIVGVELWGVEPRVGDWGDYGDLPECAIRAEDIRLPLGDLRNHWVEAHAMRAKAAGAEWEALPEDQRKPRAVHEKAVREFEQRFTSRERRPGRPRLSDELLSRVTELYNAGGPSPTQRVYDELSKGPNPPRSFRTVQGWVAEARKRGYPIAAPPLATGRRYPPGVLEEVAKIALTARRRGESEAAAVAQRFEIKPSVAKTRIARAIQLGLLEQPTDEED